MVRIHPRHSKRSLRLEKGFFYSFNVQGDRRCAASSRSVQRSKGARSTAGLAIVPHDESQKRDKAIQPPKEVKNNENANTITHAIGRCGGGTAPEHYCRIDEIQTSYARSEIGDMVWIEKNVRRRGSRYCFCGSEDGFCDDSYGHVPDYEDQPECLP